MNAASNESSNNAFAELGPSISLQHLRIRLFVSWQRLEPIHVLYLHGLRFIFVFFVLFCWMSTRFPLGFVIKEFMRNRLASFLTSLDIAIWRCSRHRVRFLNFCICNRRSVEGCQSFLHFWLKDGWLQHWLFDAVSFLNLRCTLLLQSIFFRRFQGRHGLRSAHIHRSEACPAESEWYYLPIIKDCARFSFFSYQSFH